MENLGAMAYSRYTGFRKITDRDVLELHCITFKNDTLTDSILQFSPLVISILCGQ